MKHLFTAITLFGLGLAATHQAKASIITQVVSQSGGVFTYRADLTNDQQIDAANVAFGTVYDFGPIVSISNITGLLASNFSFTTTLTNSPAYQTAPTDNPTLTNIRFTFFSTSTVSSIGPSTSLGTFMATSLLTGTRLASFDGQASKFDGGTPDTPTGNVGQILVPTSSTPEPASLLSLGTGLLALGFVGARRRKA